MPAKIATRYNPERIILNVVIHTVLILCTVSCGGKNQEPIKADWLIGKWQRTNDEGGNRTFEFWEARESEYFGLGFTLKDGDTIFKETLRIYGTNDGPVLKIMGVGDAPVIFSITPSGEAGFTAENPDNEFPKTIVYKKEGIQLQAEISDGQTTIPFYFEKLRP